MNYKIILLFALFFPACANVFAQRIDEPSNLYYIHLKQKLIDYETIEKQGKFSKIDFPKKGLKVGDSCVCMPKIKKIWH